MACPDLSTPFATEEIDFGPLIEKGDRTILDDLVFAVQAFQIQGVSLLLLLV